MKIEIFPSPRAQEDARAWNFPSPRDYMKAVLGIFSSPKVHIDMGTAKSNILTYFFILLHTFDIFLHIFLMFLHISPYSVLFSSYSFILHIFFHISFIFLHLPNVTWSGGGGCTRESWNYPVGPPPDIFSNGHFPECDVIKGWGRCTRKSWYYLAGHKTCQYWIQIKKQSGTWNMFLLPDLWRKSIHHNFSRVLCSCDQERFQYVAQNIIMWPTMALTYYDVKTTMSLKCGQHYCRHVVNIVADMWPTSSRICSNMWSTMSPKFGQYSCRYVANIVADMWSTMSWTFGQ